MIVEHRAYLSSAAVVVGGVLALHGWLGRRCAPVLLGVAVAGAMLTARRNVDFRSALAIWNDTVAKRPGNALAHTNLGIALQQGGRMAEAIAHYEEALRLQPNSPEGQNNFGDALQATGRIPEAITAFERALRLRPDYPEAHNNLGVAVRRAGDPQRAIAH
jgi:protein O-mannosyl-transferase